MVAFKWDKLIFDSLYFDLRLSWISPLIDRTKNHYFLSFLLVDDWLFRFVSTEVIGDICSVQTPTDRREIDRLTRVLQERERELEEERREKEQVRNRLQQQLEGRERQLEQAQQQGQEREREIQDLQRQLQQKERELEQQRQEKDREIQQAREQEQNLQRQLQEREQQLQREIQQGGERERQAGEREQGLQRQLQQAQQQLQESQERERGLEQQLRERDRLERESSWVVSRNDIRMTERILGRGGWGEVRVARFHGLEVAAKVLHETIISEYNVSLFSREMNIASKIRHPNLLQFIGATTEGNPIILTELMPTSLRKELESVGLAYPELLRISLDVACALNYLHLFKPHPILHRDVSSANVLLQGNGFGGFRAKVSDYGSANLQHLIIRSVNPGGPLYAAPEAANPKEHSPSMDVFSYGVLLLEMITRRIPLPEERVGLIDGIRRASFRSLVQRCLIVEYRHRPTMNDIITELNDTI
ncbi:PREDICTED: probable serine/threonine-protein kinase drkD [Amphimedon queenslandica]|uniref:Protein kinase domain-containing protein n=1 Tax=Amphimedon queenslandica TaxID=400682 RepID=A0AAN0IWI0_AMPQE|nr:PREDICTED: probable serine/threonine-protein kinase drkD [Amphimedon queenslandica]|eukprot:XP_019849145.1 PREDICTED: probable serine/threonine-protein kinase drkD [Amphimedon queenslandica]